MAEIRSKHERDCLECDPVRSRRGRRGACIVAIGVMLAAAASAQDAPPAGGPDASPAPERTPRRPPPDIEEIVVQAGESEAAADLQAGDSVTGFDASDLEALGAESIEDLAGFTPNLEIVTAGSTTPTFFIRGVGLNDFSANSTGAVAIYQDDVQKNSPALQLGTLFDMEAVNVLRGPQGTGPYRNASAGAIKLYSRRPSGGFGGFLRSEVGNFDRRDFEGAVEMPIYEDIVSSRFAFRLTKRDGWMENRCGDAPPRDERPLLPFIGSPQTSNRLIEDGGPSVCGEQVTRQFGTIFVPGGTPPTILSDGRSYLPTGIPSEVNDLDNWSTRGMLRIQPTLDQDWLLTASLSKRDELSRLGQAYGTNQPLNVCDLNVSSPANRRPECTLDQSFASPDALGYRAREVTDALNLADPCRNPDGTSNGTCMNQQVRLQGELLAKTKVAKDLVDLDDEPYEGDFNRVGPTKNDVWGVSLKGDIAFGNGTTLTTVTGYDAYDRLIDIDLDFTPNDLFRIVTDDEGWQFVQDLRLSGIVSREVPIGWEIGGLVLQEQLDAVVDLTITPILASNSISRRKYIQDLTSAAAFASFNWDFWQHFTLDGGFRYNWEHKQIDLSTRRGFSVNQRFIPFEEEDVWQDPTGTIRLTYRFREDTHAYWKYTRGWKSGHYNTTVNDLRGITTAEPETIDAFELGLRGSWFSGRLGVDAALFHYAYENYQIFTVEIPLGGNPEFVILNASDAEVYGGELDLTARPIPGLFLQGRFSWLESQFLDFTQRQAKSTQIGAVNLQEIKQIEVSGNRLLNSPQFKVSLTAEQTVPLGRYGSLSARWDGAWTDDTYYDATEGVGTGTFDGEVFLPEGTIAQEAFWLHNLRLGYRTPDGSVEIAGWIRNVTDEVYKTFGFDASSIQTFRTTSFFVGEPRTYGATLTVTF